VQVESDGKPRRVPAAGFHSDGLDELVDWLATQVRDARAEIVREAAPAPTPRALQKQSLGKGATKLRFVAGGIIAIFFVTFLMKGCLDSPASPDAVLTHVNDGAHIESGGDSAWTDVLNNSDENKSVAVTATLHHGEHAWAAQKSATIAAHSREHFNFWLPGADGGSDVTYEIDLRELKQ
jgi:hypothetical protein